jgi:hypothetical protein
MANLMSRARVRGSALLVVALIPTLVAAQNTNTQKPAEPQLPQTAVERLGPTLLRVGTIRVDTAAREMTVAGTVNADVKALEFIANARKGVRAYETAVTLDTDAITFNTALLLIGLNRARSKNAPQVHFDAAVPSGDTVDISVECPARECQPFPAERFMYDQTTKTPLSNGLWVYTGSRFLPDGNYHAQVDGSLIGFVHDPASIIEYAAGAGLNKYGSIILNPTLGLSANTAIVLKIKALTPAKTTGQQR